MAFWLIKSEPTEYSIDSLKSDTKCLWEGVRNYQARNFLMSMKVGEKALFYHSNAEPTGVAGVAQVVKLAEVDPSQFDKKSKYFDEKATKEKPIWQCPTFGFTKRFKQIVTREELFAQKSLEDMMVLKKGSRLSVQPVTEAEFELVCKLGML